MIQTLVFISNYLNHHQMPLALEFYSRLGNGYHFIQTEPMEEERIQMGWDVNCGKSPFVRNYYEEAETCDELIQCADVVICDYMDDITMIRGRLEKNRLTFWLSERIYREGQYRAISPRGLMRKYRCFTKYRKSEFYLLAVGAYVASDYHIVKAFPNKMWKWGYFPEIRGYSDLEPFSEKSISGQPVRILFAGRFLTLKHPEYAIETLKRLRDEGYSVHLDMIGDGEEQKVLHELTAEYQLKEYVDFHGFLRPIEVREYMDRADIFLFGSNYLEGWGAVINEAMNSGCAVVAGHLAGAVPFLIEQEKSGMIYESENIEDCYLKIKKLVQNREIRSKIGEEAADRITTLWNARIAAERFLSFCEAKLKNTDPLIPEDGPMSRAELIRPTGRRLRFITGMENNVKGVKSDEGTGNL